MTEQEIINAQLNIPTLSPELHVWKTPLNDKLLITGTCGVNKELIEVHNNFPRFNITHPENETEEELLTRIQIQEAEVIECLLRINPRQIKTDSTFRGQADSITCSIHEYANSVGRVGERGEKPPPLTDSKASEDEDPDLASQLVTESESDCKNCSFHVELPIQMEDSDQIFINRESGEVLIYPRNEVEDEEWIQKNVIERNKHKDEDDKAFYAKGDAMKLEKFLKQEHETTVRIIKQKCLEHSKKCEACDILSRRQDSHK